MKKVWDVAAVAGSRIVRQGVMMLVMAIAARILGKELLGTWALIYIVIQFGVLLADCGISTFIVRHRELDQRMYGTAFYISAVIAMLIATIVATIGIPLATLLGYQDFSWHFVASALAIVPLSMNGILQAKLRRDRRFNVMMISDVCANTLLLVVSIVMLRSGSQLWSFIVPVVLAAFTGFTICAVVVGIPRPQWDRDDAREIMDYSLGLVGFSSIHYWARNLDHVLIGRVLGAAPLGIYSVAYRIMMLPLSQINATAATVALPYLSPHQDNPKKLLASMRSLTVAIGMLTTLPMIWVWIERDFMVRLLLGEGWQGVADLLLLLIPLGILQALVNPTGLSYQVSGETKKYFAIGMINTAVTVTSFVIGVWLGTLQWIVICYAVANIMMVPISVGTGLRTIGGRLADWISWSAPFFVSLVMCWLIHPWLPGSESPYVRVAITVLGTSIVALPAYLFAYQMAFRKQPSTTSDRESPPLAPSAGTLPGLDSRG